MRRKISLLWKANIVAFLSSFCVMVIELIAARILAPHIGVSLYTWTSIIGVILGGIALGNYLGGRLADRFPSPFLLMQIFFVGGLLTAAIVPFVKIFAGGTLFSGLPVMWEFVAKAASVFLFPALVLSMVSPMVIKLTLADVERTGGVVGTIYAFSTLGSILGTFLTGFYFILWFGTGMMLWIIAAALILVGVIAWLLWRSPERTDRFARRSWITLAILLAVVGYLALFLNRTQWQQRLVRESNYYAIDVRDAGDGTQELILDNLIHGYVDPERPTDLRYDYLQVFAEITGYTIQDNQDFSALHLGGGTYMFPRYLKALYPESRHEVVEIDPEVTRVAHSHLGLAADTPIVTHNRDARLFLIERDPAEGKFDIVVGDVFNDRSTPFHLTTLEFDRLVKRHMATDGVYMINIIDSYRVGRYMPSFIYTLKQAFKNVYLLSPYVSFLEAQTSTFVIVATDRQIDLEDYHQWFVRTGAQMRVGMPHDEATLDEYLADRHAILLTDDHVPTDIFVSFLFER